MAEARRARKNGRKVVSLFSGAGGSSLGYRLAGFEIAYANEMVEAARATYSANFPKAAIDPRDVRLVTPYDVLEKAGLRSPGDLDVLDGSPPCASYSQAARHEGGLEGGWGKQKEYGRDGHRQRTDDLFGEYLRLLEGLRPKAFVAENVYTLAIGKAKGHFLNILERMEGAGYRVAVRALDAQWLGVPQVRRRLIFVGIRRDLEIEPEHPEPLPYRYTVEDALRGLVGDVEPEARVEGYAIEPESRLLLEGQKSEKFFNLRRLAWGEPARTVLASSGHPGAAGPLHPDGRRKLTIAELKRVCSFPDDFVLTGTYEQRWERLGRAVPPLMMKAIASRLAATLAASGR